MSRNGQRNKKPRAKLVQKALARQQEKERAKVAVHIKNLQDLDAGDKNPHIQELKQQLQLVVNGHNDLVTAYNQNWHGFGASIQHLDSRVGAIALVLDDLMRGGLDNVSKLGPLDAPSPDHPTVGGVHWAGYIKMYLNQVALELEEIKVQRAAAEAASPVHFDPLITPPEIQTEDDANDVVFGGKDNDDVEASTGQAASAPG
jgi:hypothetical protein